MVVEIKYSQLEDGLILVNNKEVRQDMNGNWIGKHLTMIEAKFFNEFMNTVKRCKTLDTLKVTYEV